MGNFQIGLGKNNKGKRTYEFGVNTSISLPRFLLVPSRVFTRLIPRTEISLVYNYQQRAEYIRNSVGAKYAYTWSNESNKLNYNIRPVQVNVIKLSNLSDDFYKLLDDPYVKDQYSDKLVIGSGASFIYTTNPVPNPKYSYLKVSAELNVAGNLLSALNKILPLTKDNQHSVGGVAYSQFVSTELSANYTWMFGRDNKSAIAVRALGGIGFAYGNSLSLPFENAFWVGGANSLRGWHAKSLGPGSSPKDTVFSIPNQLGDFRLEANVEYRFPIVSVLRGALFADVGNIWLLSDINKSFISEIAIASGIGLRLDIDFVVVRLDWGFKVYDPLYKEWNSVSKWFSKGRNTLQFGIGYPF